jgi:DNA-directed RNA polymerase specialized sigma subunit
MLRSIIQRIRRRAGTLVTRSTGCNRGMEEAANELSLDCGLPAEQVSEILNRATAELRELADQDTGTFDARPIIDRAVKELFDRGFQLRPFENSVMEKYLQELSFSDYQILLHHQHGWKHSQISELMEVSVETVQRSLVKTYAELRMRMMNCDNNSDTTA